MTEATKKKISDSLKAKGIKPKVIFDATGTKHKRPNPRIGEKRPKEIGKKISESKKGHLVSQETREKISKSLMGKSLGEKSPVWIKDRSFLKKSEDKRTSAYSFWRSEVYRLDYWKCRISSKQCQGRIEAHHILSWRDYPELRYKLENGITLCHYHHPRRRVDEVKLSPYLKKLVAERK